MRGSDTIERAEPTVWMVRIAYTLDFNLSRTEQHRSRSYCNLRSESSIIRPLQRWPLRSGISLCSAKTQRGSGPPHHLRRPIYRPRSTHRKHIRSNVVNPSTHAQLPPGGGTVTGVAAAGGGVVMDGCEPLLVPPDGSAVAESRYASNAWTTKSRESYNPRVSEAG